MSIAEWNDTNGSHDSRILRSSYRKLSWVGFQPRTTEFRSDDLTDWAIRPWAQLTLRTNFVQLLQFHPFAQCSRFVSAIFFVRGHICIEPNLADVIIWVHRNELIYMLFTSEELAEVALEIWLEWHLNPGLLNSIQRL